MIPSKCRRLTLALVAPLAMWLPLNVWALGMGEIDVESALNEQFRAAIPLTDARDLQQPEIVVSLASREDFERVGVERFHFLTTLNFEVDTRGREPIVRLTSSQPISEPYLNFIVEVMWPQGRLLKEFTVLLDPPTFSAVQAPAVDVAQEQSVEMPAAVTPERNVQSQGQVALSQPASASARPASRSAQTGEIFTTRDDTLWTIANRTRAERVDVNQQMLAIQDLNPRAFLRNNINLLKAGYQLALPSEAQALALSSRQAQTEVIEQSDAWRNRAAESRQQVATNAGETLQSQVDATPEIVQAVVEEETEQGQVRIVAAGGDLVAGSSPEAGSEAGRLLEQNETLNRQVDELEYQLDREKELAQNQVELKSRELEVRDQELAALQNRLQELEKQVAQRPQNQTTAPAQELPVWQSPMVLGGIIGVLILLLTYLLLKSRRSVDDDGIAYAYTRANQEDHALGKPLENAPPVEPSLADQGNVDLEPVDVDRLDEDLGRDSVESEDANSAQPDNVVEFETTAMSEDEGVEDLLHGIESSEVSPDEAQDSGSDASDVIGEADIYTAYGRHGQAMSLLDGALRTAPNRHDVRLKLLEVCADTENTEQFAEHAEYLIEHCDDEEILMACRELEGRLTQRADNPNDAASSTAGDDAHDLLAAEAPAVATQDELSADKAPADDDDLFSIDDLEGELETEQADTSEPIEALSEGGEFELEFDSGAESETETQDDQSPVSESGDLDFSELEALEAAEDGRNAPSNPVEQDLDEQTMEPSPLDEDMGDFDFGAEGETDINATKIDLAEAYIDMGDGDGATDILKEVLEEGSSEQKRRAQELLDGID